MLRIKKSRGLIFVLVSLLTLVSFATIAFATSSTYDKMLPALSMHDTIVDYVARSTSTGGMSNSCTKSVAVESNNQVDHITWVDQQSIGTAVTYDLQIGANQSSSYNMKAYPKKGEMVRARGRGINVLYHVDVGGTIYFN